MARPAGFEPTTPWFVAKYSIHLSYGRIEGGIIAKPPPPVHPGRMSYFRSGCGVTRR